MLAYPPMSEERLTELEVRYTVQQDLLRQLSDVVLAQGRDLDRLRRELELLRSRQHEAPSPFTPDERPPHYSALNKTQLAHCACGKLQAETSGEPSVVSWPGAESTPWGAAGSCILGSAPDRGP